MLGADVFAELNQETGAADVHSERKESLRRIQLIGREEAFAEGRHAEVDERMLEAFAAKTAAVHLRVAHAPRIANGRIHIHKVLRPQSGAKMTRSNSTTPSPGTVAYSCNSRLCKIDY